MKSVKAWMEFWKKDGKPVCIDDNYSVSEDSYDPLTDDIQVKPVIISDPVELSEGELAAVKDLLGPINHGFTAAGKSALRKLCEQNRIEIKEIISREDALKIASHILETAEKERIEHAEKEAKVGIQYDK